MTIRMGVHRRLGPDSEAYSGATADVFCVGAEAWKVFRVFGVARTPEQVQRLFQAECEAYKRIQVDPWLSQHVPKFFGSAAVVDIIDATGNSVAPQYALDCCYRMEFVPGDEVKLTADGLRERYPHLQEAQARFAEHGINVLDSSVWSPEDPAAFKLIDFRVDHRTL